MEKVLPAKGFGGKGSWKGNRQGSNVIQLRETCHSEAVTDVTAVGIRIVLTKTTTGSASGKKELIARGKVDK